MSNFVFISTKKPTNENELNTCLLSISKNKFKNLIKIENSGNRFFVSFSNRDKKCSGFGLWIANSKKIGIHKPYGTWMPYVFYVFCEELNIAFDGKITGENSKDCYQGNYNKIKSFSDYLYYAFNTNTFDDTNSFAKLAMKDAPDELKNC